MISILYLMYFYDSKGQPGGRGQEMSGLETGGDIMGALLINDFLCETSTLSNLRTRTPKTRRAFVFCGYSRA